MKSRQLWLVAGLLVFFSALAACGGGGSNSVPRSAATGSASGGSVVQAQTRVAFSIILGSMPLTHSASVLRTHAMGFRAGTKRAVAFKRRAQAKRAAAGGSRSPQYLNEDYTDELTIYTQSETGVWSSPSSYDVSLEDTIPGAPNHGSSVCTFVGDYEDGDYERSCTISITAPVGNDNFYVVSTCLDTGSCPQTGPVTLAVGASLGSGPSESTPISASMSQQISITMSPLLAPFFEATLEVSCLNAPAELGEIDFAANDYYYYPNSPFSYNGNTVDGIAFDGNNSMALDSGTSDLGPLSIQAYDASGMEEFDEEQIDSIRVHPLSKRQALGDNGYVPLGIPTTIPNPSTGNPEPNVDPFAIVQPPSAVSINAISSDLGPLSVAFAEFNGSGQLALETSGCNPGSPTLTYNTAVDVWNADFSQGSGVQPELCFNNNAPLANGLPYYAVVTASAGSTVLDQIYVAPIVINDPVTGSASLCGSSTYECIEVGEYGYSLGALDLVDASIQSGPCEIEGFLYANNSGATYQSNSNPNGPSNSLIASYVDGNGYAQFGIEGTSTGQCTIAFEYDAYSEGSGFNGPIVYRTYNVTQSGEGGTYTITIFNQKRKPASRIHR